MRRHLLAALGAALILIAAGCGGDDDTATSPAGATGAGGRAAAEDGRAAPGAPEPGEPSYTALGSYWIELAGQERTEAAVALIADNPEDCRGLDPAELAEQTKLSFAVEFPLNVPVADAMLETCALLRH